MRRNKLGVIILLIASAIATGIVRAVAYRRHEAIVVRADRPRPADRLQGLDSFALGLLLGGLRGPLVMFLWTSSETQKSDKQLEDIDTKIELIRMLQPEFDSVHLFQIWNKAYNLSVQMATLQNKYVTILDALDYAFTVDKERPDNVNIMMSIADVYFTKLGHSGEKAYYIPRVLEETQARPARSEPRQGIRRIQHDPILDKDGFLLPHLLQPRTTSVIKAPGYSGAALQFLGRYNTAEAGGFPYGVSPLALAFNYHKRAALIQQYTHQRHEYMGEAVIDSRPAVDLRIWAEQESEYARKKELEALGMKIPGAALDSYPASADVKSDARFVGDAAKLRTLIAQAIFGYRRGSAAAAHSNEEYDRHIREARFASIQSYLNEADAAKGMSSLLAGEADYLSIIAANNDLGIAGASKDQIPALRASAMKNYQAAIDQYYRVLLSYWVEDGIAAKIYTEVVGKPTDKVNIRDVDASLYPRIRDALVGHMKANAIEDIHAGEAKEYEVYIERARARLASLKQG